MDIITIGVAAFGGGILAAFLGWLDSHEAFEVKKFGASIIRALMAGFAFAVVYIFTDGVTVKDVIMAILSGAGVDVVGNRIAGARGNDSGII